MRIAYLVHQYPPERSSGTELYTQRLARTMEERGHEVRVLTMGHDFAATGFGHVDEVVDGIPVRRLFQEPALCPNPVLYDLWNPCVRLYVASFLAEVRPDIVHVTHLSYLSASALQASRASGAHTVFTLTDYWMICPTIQLVRDDGTLCGGPEPGRCQVCLAADRHGATMAAATGGVHPPAPPRALAGAPLAELAVALPEAAYEVVERRPSFLRDEFLAHVDAAISPSAFLKGLFARAAYPADRIRVIPHGIDPEELQGARQPRTGPLRVGYVGSLSPRKGVHVLLEAVARIGPDVPITVDVHGGAESDPPYAARLRDLAAADRRVRLRGGFTRREAASIYAGLDVVVVPSLWYENAPLVVREGFVCGLPVVGSDLGGIAEALAHGGGVLVPPGDAGALGAALARLAQDAEALGKLAAQVPRVPALATEADAVEAVYRELLRPR